MMTAQIIHRPTFSMVSVDAGTTQPWEFSVSPRVNTPMRRAIVCAAAIRYVRSRLAA